MYSVQCIIYLIFKTYIALGCLEFPFIIIINHRPLFQLLSFAYVVQLTFSDLSVTTVFHVVERSRLQALFANISQRNNATIAYIFSVKFVTIEIVPV